MKRLAVLLFVCASAFAQSYTFQDDRTLAFAAGEGQSTVVAPGHPDCPAGRILASTDFKPGQQGVIVYRDLDKTETHVSDFEPVPHPENYNFGTSDHDLVSLSNGDVYYMNGILIRTLIEPKPAWFDSAYRLNFGPGARSGLIVWRSKDCGKSFQYVPELEFDSALVGDGSCALPQGALTHRHSSTGSAKYMAPFEGLPQDGDTRFRWCWGCDQLYLEDAKQPSACPRGGPHTPGGGVYKVTKNDVAGHANEVPFRVCKNCGALFRANAKQTACMAKRTHEGEPMTFFLPFGDKPIGTADKAQQGWRWCSKCQALFNGAEDSVCPAGGRHHLLHSAKYQVPLFSFPIQGQIGWVKCKKCNGLYRPGIAGNVCANGGGHAFDDGAGIKLPVIDMFGVEDQPGWTRCKHCGVLFFGPNAKDSACPAVRGHDGTGSADYHLALEDAAPSPDLQKDWRACRKCAGVYFEGEGHAGGYCPVADEGEPPIYDMGGSDGQLVKTDPQTDRMYLTFQCVGRLQDKSFAQFHLSDDFVNKTIVATSEKGAPWKTAGWLDRTGWRIGVVPFTADTFTLGWGLSDFAVHAKRVAGLWQFETNVKEVAPGAWGHDIADAKKPLYENLQANIRSHTIVVRNPGTNRIVMVMPDTIPNRGHGYRIFFEKAGGGYDEAVVPITPWQKGSDGFVFHLQAIHLGAAGPALLYWYDYDSGAKTVAIRGRFITGDGTYTEDFTLSRAGGAPRSFDAKTAMWYGDYQTADGYIKSFNEMVFHPMWVEPPGNQVHYGTVVYNPFGVAKKNSILSKVKAVPMVKAQALAKIARTKKEEAEEEEHERQAPPRRRGE